MELMKQFVTADKSRTVVVVIKLAESLLHLGQTI
jgi:hypothetical protein